MVGNRPTLVRADLTAGPIQQHEVLSGLDRQKPLIRFAQAHVEKMTIVTLDPLFSEYEVPLVTA